MDRFDERVAKVHHGRGRRVGVAAAICSLLVLASCGFGTTQEVALAEITDDTAVLRGTAFNNDAAGITHWFEYGTTNGYGSSTTVESASVEANVGLPVEALVSGLEPSTTYHYRLCVDDSAGYGVCSYDRTFTTDETTVPTACSAVFPGPMPYTMTPGEWITVSADCAPPTSAVTMVCLDFYFVDDLLDQGEAIDIRIPGDPGYGFENGNVSAQDSRTICNLQPTVTSAFATGDATFEIVLYPAGSLKIERLEVRINPYG